MSSALAQQAVALHRAGRLDQARAAYQAALAAAPRDAVLLHGFGVLQHQQGDFAAAAALLERAIGAGMVTAECQFHLGLARTRLGDWPRAEAALRRAVQLKPDWPEPHYDLGNALAAQGRADAAMRAYRAAIKLRPAYPAAAVNLAKLLDDHGRTAEAVATYRALLAVQPAIPEARNNLGDALRRQNENAAAEAEFREALRLKPDFAEALLNLGILLHETDRAAEAVAVLGRARALRPGDLRTLECLATACRTAKRYAEAREASAALLALAPADTAALFAYAEACRKLNDFAAAQEALEKILAAEPGNAEAHNDLGNVLRARGRFPEAERHFRAAIAARPSFVHMTNLWALLRDDFQLDAARILLAQTEALPGVADDPKQCATVACNRAMTDLTEARLAEGFQRFEARRPEFGIADLPGPEWLGENPAGRTILVAAEQGIGDTIQFLRYVPVLAARGARVILQMPPALAALAATVDGVADVTTDVTAPPHDAWCLVMSLPLRLGDYDPCPVPMPYVRAHPDAVRAWRARLPDAALRVGLVWAGNTAYGLDAARSIDPALLAPLAAVPGASFVSLQKPARGVPLFPVLDWTEELTDLAATAALIMALDAVVAVDTGVAHLAGALGAKVLMLNRHDADWRWGLPGTRNLWYPTLTDCRQSAPRDWTASIAAATSGLMAILADRAA